MRARKKQIYFSERMKTFPQTPGKGEKANTDLEATSVGKVGRYTRKGPGWGYLLIRRWVGRRGWGLEEMEEP